MPGHQPGDGTQVSGSSPGPINQASLCNIQLACSDMEVLLVTTGEYEFQEIYQYIRGAHIRNTYKKDSILK